MANNEHLAKLSQSVGVWNAWRQANPGVRSDFKEADLRMVNLRRADLSDAMLSGANLRGAILREANLSGADLSRTNLEWTNLRRANLRRADLRKANLGWANLKRATLSAATLSLSIAEGADLSGADLSGADLSGANLSDATLSGANLRGATLSGANLRGATLSGADFSRANLFEATLSAAYLQECLLDEAVLSRTIFADVDLRGVQGLKTVRHVGPSTIGVDTIYNSRGDIPDDFLRGCGVPDTMIEYARSLVTAERPIDYYSVFISYSSKDEALATRLYADLQAAGVRCWYAPHDLPIGAPILSGIDQAIRFHDKLLLILSVAAVESTWIEQEVEMALARERAERRRVLFPIRIDDAVSAQTAGWPALVWRQRHVGDFRKWHDYAVYQQAFDRLLRDLKAKQP